MLRENLYVSRLWKEIGTNHYYDKCLSFKFGIKKKGHAKLFIVNKNLKIEKVYESLKHVSTANFRKEYSLIQKKNESIQSPVYIIQDVITEELRIKLMIIGKIIIIIQLIQIVNIELMLTQIKDLNLK